MKKHKVIVNKVVKRISLSYTRRVESEVRYVKYYCIGIKGTGMSTLAQILFDLGNEVSGYDDARGHKFTQDGLEERGIDKLNNPNVWEAAALTHRNKLLKLLIDKKMSKTELRERAKISSSTLAKILSLRNDY